MSETHSHTHEGSIAPIHSATLSFGSGSRTEPDPEKAAIALAQAEEDAHPAAARLAEKEGAAGTLEGVPEDRESDFPEGGWKAWLCVFGSWWSTFITFGYLNAFGVFQEYYQQTFFADRSSSSIAWLGSFQYFLIFATGMVAGRLFDLGYFRPMLTIGCLLLVFSQMMLSLCTEYYQFFLAQGVGLGLAFGLVFNLSVSSPGHWFNAKRATAFGVMASGSSTGGVIFPIMIKKLIPQIGFGWTMRVVGFMALGMLLISWSCQSTRLPPLARPSGGGWRSVKFVDLSAFKNPAYSSFVVGATLVMFGLYTPFTYMDVFTSYYNIPANGYFLSILNAASIFGRVLPGLVADKLGRINTVFPHLMVSGILIFIFPLCTSLGGLLPFSILFGFTSGCYVSLIPACVAQLGPTSNIGTRLGMMFGAMSIGGLFGTPAAGGILGTAPNYDWWAVCGFSGACVVAGSICVLASRQYALKGAIYGKI